MWDRIVLCSVVTFVLRQLAKFGRALDWEKVKTDAESRVRAFVPGTMFDNGAVAAVRTAVDACRIALAAEEDLCRVFGLITANDWDGAFRVLKDLLTQIWYPAAVRAQLASSASHNRVIEALDIGPVAI